MPVCGAPTSTTSRPCQRQVASDDIRCPKHQWDVPVLEEAPDPEPEPDAVVEEPAVPEVGR